MGRMQVFRRFSALVCLFVFTSWIHGSHRVYGQSPEAVSHNKPIKELLNADGTLNLTAGFAGSLDVRGYRMIQTEFGAPRFALVTSTSSKAATDDEFWDDAFFLPGTNLFVNALAVSGSDLYAGGGFTTAGGAGTEVTEKTAAKERNHESID